jgi:hypothetical protein
MAKRIPAAPIYQASVEIEGTVVHGYATLNKFDDGTFNFLCQFGDLPLHVQKAWQAEYPDVRLPSRKVLTVVEREDITVGLQVDPAAFESVQSERTWGA